MLNKASSKLTTISLLVVTALVAFALDVFICPEVDIASVYIPLCAIVAWRFGQKETYGFTILCILVAVLGAVLSPLSGTLARELYFHYAESIVACVIVTALAFTARSTKGKLMIADGHLQQSEQELRRFVEQLRDSEANYRSLVENIQHGVFRKDLEGRFTFANHRFCEMLGKPMEQILGTTDLDQCPAELAAKYRTDDLRTVDSGATLEIVDELRAPDGSLHTYQTVKTPVIDSEGHIVATQGICWDITLRRRAEEAILRSEREFRELAENLPDVVSRFDRQLRHLYVNRAIQRVTGRQPETFLGKTNAELGMPYELCSLWESKIRAAFESAVEQTVEFKYENSSGLRHFEGSIVPELSPDGRVETVLCICRDVTERVRAKEQEVLHLAELAHLSRLSTVGGLVSEIAHEINQPLQAITNYSQAAINVLEKAPNDRRENVFDWLKHVSEQANRAAEIIRRAGRYVRKTPFRRSTIDLNELLRDCLKLIAFDLRLNHVSLRCELAEPMPTILGDFVQIQQVVVNLIRNAVDATMENREDDRQVLIRTNLVDSGVQISVGDNGCGLQSGDRGHLFEPFFTTKPNGLGLGLAVCQSIAQAHHGLLTAQSNSDRGTTFAFILPVARGEIS